MLCLAGCPGAGAITQAGISPEAGKELAGQIWDGGKGKAWFLSLSEGGLSGAFLVS